MTRPAEFQTEDLDLVAAIMTATGREPVMYRKAGTNLITFEVAEDEQARAILLAYATGELILPVKRFAACRAWLYRKAKGVR